jgi:hypothetical protein
MARERTAAERRRNVRRTVLVLVVLALGVYVVFIGTGGFGA